MRPSAELRKSLQKSLASLEEISQSLLGGIEEDETVANNDPAWEVAETMIPLIVALKKLIT
jgi:hypothetical protein